MRQLTLIMITALLSGSAFAQSANGVFFSEFGEKFIVYINNVQQNDEYSANVRVEDIAQDFVQVRIDFESDEYPDFQANAGFERGQETTYLVKKNRKGEYVLRARGFMPIADAPQPEAPAEPAVAPQPAQPVTPAPSGTKTTTTTTTTTKGGDGDVGVKMDTPGGSISINIDAPDMDTEMEITETRTETVVTETYVEEPQGRMTRSQESAVPGYNGPFGCDWPTDDAGFTQMKKSISGKTFDDAKMTVAKQATRNKCLTASQVKEVMAIFTFEEDKLEYAKFAYDYTYDQGNYYMVNDVFDFEFTIDELNEYIESK